MRHASVECVCVSVCEGDAVCSPPPAASQRRAQWGTRVVPPRMELRRVGGHPPRLGGGENDYILLCVWCRLVVLRKTGGGEVEGIVGEKGGLSTTT